jgi:hypothetical protein
MSLRNLKKSQVEKIPLLRGGAVISSFTNAFGGQLRETRLTAILGYLIALESEPFCQLFGFQGKASSVSLETLHEHDRSDILVTTTAGLGVVEAKVSRINPFHQALKYPADWRVLLTEHLPTAKEKTRKNCRYLRWCELEPTLAVLSKNQNQAVRFVATDLLRYLKEHHMSRNIESTEIYAREINEETTLKLFLHAQMYGCKYEASSLLPEALYFAPHFGQYIAKTYPGIKCGISYIAAISDIEVVSSFGELVEAAKKLRGKLWYDSHAQLISPVRKWPDWRRGGRVSFLFLAQPRLVFNPPIQKESLQKGKGWLSKRVFSFDEFFQAWGC